MHARHRSEYEANRGLSNAAHVRRYARPVARRRFTIGDLLDACRAPGGTAGAWARLFGFALLIAFAAQYGAR